VHCQGVCVLRRMRLLLFLLFIFAPACGYGEDTTRENAVIMADRQWFLLRIDAPDQTMVIFLQEDRPDVYQEAGLSVNLTEHQGASEYRKLAALSPGTVLRFKYYPNSFSRNRTDPQTSDFLLPVVVHPTPGNRRPGGNYRGVMLAQAALEQSVPVRLYF
jgi:hypothetical protein